MKVLIYGGTTEGRKLAEILQKSGAWPVVSVATEYGEEVLEHADPGIDVRMGRLDVQQMHDLAVSGEFDAVVDATHPFAVEVSRNIRDSIKGTDLPLLRLSRARLSGSSDDELSDGSTINRRSGKNAASGKPEVIHCDSVSECALALRKTTGNILLTTGSKELGEFCEYEDLRKRIIARVLPGEESLRLCREARLSGKQIIAMQGPFSEELNLAIIHQYEIAVLVTKESGHAGGTDAKITAAEKAGISCYVIRRPEEQKGERSYTLDEVLEELGKLENQKEPVDDPAAFRIVLAGIGMGTEATLTGEVRKALKQAGYVFGAERMLDSVQKWIPDKAERIALYEPAKVVPEIRRILGKNPWAGIVILFSGDSGFYSGAAGMRKALLEAGFTGSHQIIVMPGISSLSYLSAAAGIPWQDAAVVSLHGVPEKVWKDKLLAAMQDSRKVFFLTSGAKDVRALGSFLKNSVAANAGHREREVVDPRAEEARKEPAELSVIQIILGYQLSYPDQKIMYTSPEECARITEEGLYAGFLIQNAGTVFRERILTPGIRDDQFVRGQVPMTKEEIRELVICKLHLYPGSILYDIGSGTGSIAVEAARLPGMGDVYAIEQNPEGIALIRRNAEKFGTRNVHIIHGMAPEVLMKNDADHDHAADSEKTTDPVPAAALPVPTHAFLGGTKGNLEAILETLRKRNPAIRIVMTAVTMETIRDMQDALDHFGIVDADLIAVSVSRAAKMGSYHLMKSANTVYICSFEFEDHKQYLAN